ncbi:hypothetical protein [Brasilonema sp. UFV-L1]|uniref:hypothetical protein n=1 Tax=Brasilonema sp. UFV-L1 TaxID=2234130 RepID=UPI00145DE2F2|nr:hypothetical protein [Brasilonema sp. UFV-L1]NMG06594.1 hypothetical protein [Brasilonema sp. UFV-L1]
MTKNRTLICTFLALLSGFFGGYIGWQITLSLHSQKCQNKTWGLKEMCHLVTPPAALPAVWQSSTRGLWTGTVLGAFVGGLVTRQNRE